MRLIDYINRGGFVASFKMFKKQFNHFITDYLRIRATIKILKDENSTEYRVAVAEEKAMRKVLKEFIAWAHNAIKKAEDVLNVEDSRYP